MMSKYFDEEDIIAEYEKQLQKKDTVIEILEENNKLLIHQKQQLYEDLDMLSERIDKAIEYIETMPLTKGTEWYRIQLLDILKGEDNE